MSYNSHYASDDSERVDIPLHVDMGGVDKNTVESLQHILGQIQGHHRAVDDIIHSMDAMSARADQLNQGRREHLELLKTLKDVRDIHLNNQAELARHLLSLGDRLHSLRGESPTCEACGNDHPTRECPRTGWGIDGGSNAHYNYGDGGYGR